MLAKLAVTTNDCQLLSVVLPGMPSDSCQVSETNSRGRVTDSWLHWTQHHIHNLHHLLSILVKSQINHLRPSEPLQLPVYAMPHWWMGQTTHRAGRQCCDFATTCSSTKLVELTPLLLLPPPQLHTPLCHSLCCPMLFCVTLLRSYDCHLDALSHPAAA